MSGIGRRSDMKRKVWSTVVANIGLAATGGGAVVGT